MTTDRRVRVYERTHTEGLVGDTIRPGGTDLTERALAQCGLPQGARLLDVGCGPAATVEHVAGRFTAAGVDPSPVLLGSARRRNGSLPLVRAHGEMLPVGDGLVDVVLAECSLSVMSDPDRALAEFHRVLRPGGHLVVSDVFARDPAGADALHRLAFDSCIRGAVSRQETIDRVEARGFVVETWEDHTDTWRSFAAQLVWAGGSIEQFWCRAGSRGDGAATHAAVVAAKPGYYLMIARRTLRRVT
jgi:ubiquinone/menaquinone biosynthesis C-methylase UbiE